MKLLINLIGGQTAPNFIAARQYKPDKILNICSKDTENKSMMFKKTFGESHFLDDIVLNDPFDLSELETAIENIKEKHINDEIILNFTGGTKPMSIGSFNGFINNNSKLIYIDSQYNRIIEYTKDTKTIKDIDCIISIKEHFAMYGHSFKEKGIDSKNNQREEKDRLKNYLKENYSSAKEFIKKYAKKYNDEKGYFKEDNEFIFNESNKAKWTREGKKLEIIVNSNRFNFEGDNFHKYFTGLWFEDLVLEKFEEYNVFNQLKYNLSFPNLDKKGEDDAELDFVAIKGHKLYIFEVKSGTLYRDYIYKLSSIKNLFSNLFAGIYFITFEENTDVKFKNMLKAFGIKVIPYSGLESFLNNLK